jgi:hypothetical protein
VIAWDMHAVARAQPLFVLGGLGFRPG